MATPKKTETGRWHIQIEVAGVRDSGTFDTKREAEAWQAQRSHEIRSMKTGKAGHVRTLREALRRYAEEVSPGKRGERWEIIRLAAYEKPEHAKLPTKMLIGEITPVDIATWRDARLKVVSRATVLRDLTLISAVFESARRDWGWVDVNPCRDVTKPAEPDHREVVIHGPQVRRMLRQLGWTGQPARTMAQAVAGAFLLAIFSGMRAGEICALRWDDIKADHCRLHTSKTGKGRDVPLTPGARRVIELMRGFDSETVFGLKAQTLDALFRRAREKAGLSGFTFHDSRHTAATRLAQHLHVLDLCKMFGWSSTTRALTYYNPKASEIAKRLSAGSPTRSPR